VQTGMVPVDRERYWPNWPPSSRVVRQYKSGAMMGVRLFLALFVTGLNPLLELVFSFAQIMEQAGEASMLFSSKSPRKRLSAPPYRSKMSNESLVLMGLKPPQCSALLCRSRVIAHRTVVPFNLIFPS